MELIDKKNSSIISHVDIKSGTAVVVEGPFQEFLIRRLVCEEDVIVDEWLILEDKIRCSVAFSKKGGRILVRDMKTCLNRYKAEIKYGSLTTAKSSQNYLELLRNFWTELKKVSETKERVELGCWCVDEPDTPAKKLKYEHPSCHLQAILELIHEEFGEEIPDNVFVINVKKPFLSKRGITADEWNSNPGNFYLGYRMPFLPFENHPLRNVYKIEPIPVLGKRRGGTKKALASKKKK